MVEVSTLHKALYTIKKLKQLLQEQQSTTFQPIAIVGLSCRFPQAINKTEYWQLLSQGKSAVARIPEQRWELLKNTAEFFARDAKHPYWGSFLADITGFDAYFFGISPREALRMDPQQRLLLEVSYEAIVDAGFSLESLRGSNTGVFASLYASQFSHLQKLETDMDALYLPTGSAISIAANRISYQFDLRGPSVVLDTSCSSSLVALHLACLNLQNKLCDLALVGAVNINLLPSINLVLSKAKMLSPDGLCNTFDAGANGYVPGEGVGAIVLKPLAQALKDKDRVYAVIAGSAVNQDGKSNGLTAPNGASQEIVLQSAYKAAQIDPQELSYIECHGTGTFLGDPIEVQALGQVISKNRSPQHPCWIGSVKTNLGHLEPAAGIASVIKVALALQQAKIPPHLNFSIPNPHIAFDKYHFQVPKQLEDWPQYGAHRLAGVSSFGFGGTNAHIVMRAVTMEENQHVADHIEPTTHSWQHKIYWPELFHAGSPQKENSVYPLQGKSLSSPLNIQQFAFVFDLAVIPELKDTHNILHAGYYLEMLAFAVNELYQQSVFTVEDLQFLSAIMVPNETAVNVQLILEVTDNKETLFSFYSSTQAQPAWSKHATGKLLLQASTDKKLEEIASIKKNSSLNKSSEAFYNRISTMGMPAGDSIRWTQQYWQNSQEILCEFQTPHACDSNKSFKLNIHPGIVDACIQPLFMLLPEDINQAYVSTSMDKIKYFGLPAGQDSLYLHATLNKPHEIFDEKKFSGDWCLIDKNGKIIIECENNALIQLNKAAVSQLMPNKEQAMLDLSGLTFLERKQKLTHYLHEQVAIIFAMPKEDISIQTVLRDIGMDSLMALALMKIIETALKGVCPVQGALQELSITEIVNTLLPSEEISADKSQQQNQPIIASSIKPWIAYHTPRAQAKMRLFCFPYGGGGATAYRDWQDHLPEFIEVCPIQLPGREARMGEPVINDINLLLEKLITHLTPQFDLPFAFFGHSFGSLIAFELTRYLRKHNLPLPLHIFAAAYPAPHLPTTSLNNLLNQLNNMGLDLFDFTQADSLKTLSNAQLNSIIDAFYQNGIADYNDPMMNADILKILLPIFIADIKLVNDYGYQDEPPLDMPLTVFIGKQDTWVPYDDHFPWAIHTRKNCEFYELDGSHLFIRNKDFKEQVLQKITILLKERIG